MAKSLRSKWKRKCRAIKRERYGKKELDRLKKTLGITDTSKQEVDLEKIAEIANVTDPKTITEQEESEEEQDQEMEVDTGCGKRKYNLKTYRDEHGSYPVWLNPRKIPRKKKNKKSKKRKTKK